MIYIVMGSEDGYCMTFGSKKKAMGYGELYILEGGDCKEEEIEVSENDYYVTMYGANGTKVEIIKTEITR
jgi:hypothetical protein